MADSWLQRTFCGFDRNVIKSSRLILIITFCRVTTFLVFEIKIVAPSIERVLANQVSKSIVVNCKRAHI